MSLKLRIVSPEKIVFVGDVESVIVPGMMGEFQVLPNHAPLISSLEPGRVVLTTAPTERLIRADCLLLYEMIRSGVFRQLQYPRVITARLLVHPDASK